MKVSICVAQPGYLPDSEDYPYEVEGSIEDIWPQIRHEYDLSVPDTWSDSKYEKELGVPLTALNQEIKDTLSEMASGTLDSWLDSLPNDSYNLEVNLIER